MGDHTQEALHDVELFIPTLLSRLMGLAERMDTTVGQVVVQLTRDLVENRIAPGQQLNSIELARRFGLSRTPVREALVLLEKEGLIEVPPRKRPCAIIMSEERIAEIYGLRGELYNLVAYKAASAISREGLSHLRQILGCMEAACGEADATRYFWYNVLYHESLASAVGNPTLKRSIDALGVSVLQLRNRNMNDSMHRQRSLDDHARMTLALEEGDGQLAGAISRNLVTAGLRRLQASMACSK